MEITEEFLMTLLCQAGAARSAVMQSLVEARKGDFANAYASFTAADEALEEVHKTQTELIGFDEGEGKIKMTLILTHIQDHIMNAMLCRDLAFEIIDLQSKIQNKELAC